jgi:hypothetical protein
LRPRTDLSAADWIVDGLGRFGDLLPSSFESYARILHPMWRAEGHEDPEAVKWETIAAEMGREMHPRIDFDSLIGAERGASRAYEPYIGDMPPSLLSALCEVLAGHTATPERCWFCLWEGWGWVEGAPSAAVMLVTEDGGGEAIDMPPAFSPEVMAGPRVSLPGRRYLLFEGPLAAATEMGWRTGELIGEVDPDADVDPDEFSPQSPSLFWPDDHAWCVATEIDLDSTYIGGSDALVQDLLADSRIEAWRAGLDDVNA